MNAKVLIISIFVLMILLGVFTFSVVSPLNQPWILNETEIILNLSQTNDVNIIRVNELRGNLSCFWINGSNTDLCDINIGNYVEKSGDTITGNLNITGELFVSGKSNFSENIRIMNNTKIVLLAKNGLNPLYIPTGTSRTLMESVGSIVAVVDSDNSGTTSAFSVFKDSPDLGGVLIIRAHEDDGLMVGTNTEQCSDTSFTQVGGDDLYIHGKSCVNAAAYFDSTVNIVNTLYLDSTGTALSSAGDIETTGFGDHITSNNGNFQLPSDCLTEKGKYYLGIDNDAFTCWNSTTYVLNSSETSIFGNIKIPEVPIESINASSMYVCVKSNGDIYLNDTGC